MADPGGIPFGHFTLGKRLARGGMAEVFLARQRGPEGFDRRVAVKRILPHLADAADFVRMFLDEARLAARLSHPNIVHIYELGNVLGDYFIAMEYVDGIHAGQLVKHAEGEPVPPELVARIGADAAGALAYAHRLTDASGRPLQLVHRDVSPQNIMVSSDGIVKLVDFGIAKAVSKAEETRPGVVKGKYAYMSPEQTTGKPLDGRSDVFSLGVVLWEIVAGRTIVERGDVVEAMKVMRDGRFKNIREVAPRTPPALADAITRALTLRKDDRPTAVQLQVMLEAYIKSAPRLATPVQLAEWIAPRFPRGQLTGEDGAAEPLRTHVSGPGAALRPARPSTDVAVVTSQPALLPVPDRLPSTVVAPVSDRLPSTVVAPVSDRLPPTVVPPVPDEPLPPAAPRAPRLPRAGREVPAEPATETVTPLPPPRRAPPPLPRGATEDEAPTLDLPPGLGDGTTQIRPPSGPVNLRRSTGPVDRLVDEERRLRLHGTGLFHKPSGPRVRPRRSPWPLVLLALIAATVVAIVVVLLEGDPPPDARIVGPPPVDAAAPVLTIVALDGGVAVDAPPVEAAAPDGGPDELIIETATLEIITRPAGARIGLPGQPVRTSPTVMTGLPVGRVTFTVGKDGFTPAERTVTLAAGEHRTLEIVLTAEAQPRRRSGYLTARTEPYSLVYLRGKLIGETPFAGLELPAGTHTLVFKHPKKRPYSRRVTITAGKTTKLDLRIP